VYDNHYHLDLQVKVTKYISILKPSQLSNTNKASTLPSIIVH